MDKVLVIENDAPLCWLLERILNKFDVVVMENGLDALAWLSDGNTCDLIISDIQMPQLSGVELLESIKGGGLYQQIPVIMLSALEDEKKRCLELGARQYLVKPFRPQTLIDEVQRALGDRTENVVS